MHNRRPEGQIGLLLLLIMGVVVALVMSVASRSLSDTVLSRQEKESSAAFALAESGVENALNAIRQGSVPSGITTLNDSTGLVSGQYGVSPESTYTLYLREGETATLDLAGFVGPNLTILWTKKSDQSENLTCVGEGSGSAPAAIEITAISSSDNTATRSYYNPSGCVLPGNGFDTSSSGGTDYLSSITYPVIANTTSVRLKPLYAGTTISVSGAGLQTQLYLIKASAVGGDAQKEIEVRRGLEAPPSILDYALFSGGTIVK